MPHRLPGSSLEPPRRTDPGTNDVAGLHLGLGQAAPRGLDDDGGDGFMSIGHPQHSDAKAVQLRCHCRSQSTDALLPPGPTQGSDKPSALGGEAVHPARVRAADRKDEVMKKTMFVSSSSQDKRLADELITQLGNAFEGDLLFSSASADLAAGAKWKDWIKGKLKTCDASLFVMTPTYAQSLWSSAEFTAFWLGERPIFVLLVGGATTDHLFQPMRDDYQATHISDKDGLKRFMENLSRFCERSRTPVPFC